MADPTDTAARIAQARDELTAKLGELRRREARVRTALSPMRHLANPWLRIGVAAFVGYRLGRPSPVRATVEASPARSETLVDAVVRASLVAVAQVVVRRIVAKIAAGTAPAPAPVIGEPPEEPLETAPGEAIEPPPIAT